MAKDSHTPVVPPAQQGESDLIAAIRRLRDLGAARPGVRRVTSELLRKLMRHLPAEDNEPGTPPSRSP